MKPPELPKLTSCITEVDADGWRRDVPCDYSWDELNDTFPPDDGSIVSQLAAVVKSDRAELAAIRARVETLEGLLHRHFDGIINEMRHREMPNGPNKWDAWQIRVVRWALDEIDATLRCQPIHKHNEIEGETK